MEREGRGFLINKVLKTMNFQIRSGKNYFPDYSKNKKIDKIYTLVKFKNKKKTALYKRLT